MAERKPKPIASGTRPGIVTLVGRHAPRRQAQGPGAALELVPEPGVERQLKLEDEAPDRSEKRRERPSRPARVLLVAADRRYRTVALALLTRRGYTVTSREQHADIAKLAARERADVVVFDATTSLTLAAREAARLMALDPPVAIVAVSSEPHRHLTALPVLEKWSSFDALFAAIDRAHRDPRGRWS